VVFLGDDVVFFTFLFPLPDLSGNLLTDLKPGLFANLTHLVELNLSRNQLIGLRRKSAASSSSKPVWELPLPGLERLNLAHNRLTEVPDRSFKALTGLRVLDLSHNQLHSLGDEALVGLKVRQDFEEIFSVLCLIFI
jgi:Leucine-rich repeat (LRR) protein